MFLVGHGAWAYVLATITARLLGVRSSINPYFAMLLGMVPDTDILLYELGIRHRSITHSILFWAMLFIPFFIIYRRRSLPYFTAVIQHIMLGDIVVASTRVLWPLDYELGFRLSLTSSTSITLEFIGLAIMALLILRYDKVITDKSLAIRLLSIITVIPILGSLVYMSDLGMFITEHVTAKRLSISDNIQYVILLHSLFLILILLPFLQDVKSVIARLRRG